MTIKSNSVDILYASFFDKILNLNFLNPVYIGLMKCYIIITIIFLLNFGCKNNRRNIEGNSTDFVDYKIKGVIKKIKITNYVNDRLTLHQIRVSYNKRINEKATNSDSLKIKKFIDSTLNVENLAVNNGAVVTVYVFYETDYTNSVIGDDIKGTTLFCEIHPCLMNFGINLETNHKIKYLNFPVNTMNKTE